MTLPRPWCLHDGPSLMSQRLFGPAPAPHFLIIRQNRLFPVRLQLPRCPRSCPIDPRSVCGPNHAVRRKDGSPGLGRYNKGRPCPALQLLSFFLNITSATSSIDQRHSSLLQRRPYKKKPTRWSPPLPFLPSPALMSGSSLLPMMCLMVSPSSTPHHRVKHPLKC